MSEHAGPAAALKGHGFTSVARNKDSDGSIVIHWARARTNVRLTIRPRPGGGDWTAEITGTRATKPVTIEADLDALEQRISK